MLFCWCWVICVHRQRGPIQANPHHMQLRGYAIATICNCEHVGRCLGTKRRLARLIHIILQTTMSAADWVCEWLCYGAHVVLGPFEEDIQLPAWVLNAFVAIIFVSLCVCCIPCGSGGNGDGRHRDDKYAHGRRERRHPDDYWDPHESH